MNHRLFTATAAIALMFLAGCAQVSHVASGELKLKDKMLVTVDQPWNQFERGLGDNTLTWTQDGITVDALRFYVGIKGGELLAPTPSQPKGEKPLTFRSDMSVQQVVALFETLYSRGGSSFTLDKLTPEPFAGHPGFRFEFSSIRKDDDVRLRGMGWGVVRGGELYAVTFTAPRLAFYPRHLASATTIARSARFVN